MKKNVSFLFLLFTIVTTYSQEKVFETNNTFLKPLSKRNESFALSNQKNNDLMLILSERTSVKSILLDSLHQEKTSIIAEPLPPKYKHFIGYNIKNKIYSILFTNDKKSKFGVLQFNTKDNSFFEKKLEFKLKKELFIESIIYENDIFLFTITKRSSKLNIYKFDENFTPKKHTLSLDKVEFPRIPGSSIKSTAYTLLTKNKNSFETSVRGVSKIESQNPNVIETTSKKIKIYQENNQVIFSFDNNPERTDLFYIDLKSFELSYKSYDKASKERTKYKKNNSYLFEKKLFQISSSNDIMNFRIIDLKTDNIIQDYYIEKTDSIPFKNSSIIQEKSGTRTFGIKIDKTKETEKTSQFLKKISLANLGISVYKINDLYNIVLGGTKEYDPDAGLIIAATVIGGAALAGAGAGAVITPVNPTYTNFNPTYSNYYSYGATKSVYIHCLFNENLKHIKGQVPLNTFDLINDFEESLENPRAINVFIHNNRLHYNYSSKKEKKFKLYRFKK